QDIGSAELVDPDSFHPAVPFLIVKTGRTGALTSYFFSATATPSRSGRMVVYKSDEAYRRRLNSRIALVMASGALFCATLPLQRTLSVMNKPPYFRRGTARRRTRG